MSERVVKFVGGPLDGETKVIEADKKAIEFPVKYVEDVLGLGEMVFVVRYFKDKRDDTDTFYYWGPVRVDPQWIVDGYDGPTHFNQHNLLGAVTREAVEISKWAKAEKAAKTARAGGD